MRSGLLFLAVLNVFASFVHVSRSCSDTPEENLQEFAQAGQPASYQEALKAWSSAEQISQWVKANFRYDLPRALEFSETKRKTNNERLVLSPAQLFERRSGVCLDLSRFCVESLAQVHGESQPKYFLIKFEPFEIKGNIFRAHWMASFRRDNRIYFFCDSHRPGHIAGPYSTPEEFIQEYEKYRARKVTQFQELETYVARKRFSIGTERNERRQPKLKRSEKAPSNVLN